MRSLLLAALLLALAPTAHAANPVVRFTTPMGAFDVELCHEKSAVCDQAAPDTVDNFLSYVDSGAYESSLIHRAKLAFVIQGGSFRRDPGPIITKIPTNAPVPSEFSGFTNRRGTLAVPLLGDGPTPCDTVENSGTSGWFVNVGQNTFLDCGLFTVFGVVLDDGMQVVDAISLLPTVNMNSDCLDPIFPDPPAPVAGAFTDAPITEAFWDLLEPSLPAQSCEDLPAPSAFGEALIGSEITRVPEPGGPAAALAASAALAGLVRRRCTAPR